MRSGVRVPPRPHETQIWVELSRHRHIAQIWRCLVSTKIQTKSKWSLVSVALTDAYTDFMLSRQAMQCSPATLQFYRFTLGASLAWLELQGATEPKELTPRLVRQYLAELASRGKAEGSERDYARALRSKTILWMAEKRPPRPTRQSRSSATVQHAARRVTAKTGSSLDRRPKAGAQEAAPPASPTKAAGRNWTGFHAWGYQDFAADAFPGKLGTGRSSRRMGFSVRGCICRLTECRPGLRRQEPLPAGKTGLMRPPGSLDVSFFHTCRHA